MRQSIPARALAALPDAVTAAAFALIWLAPLALGDSAVRNAMLVMLVEFILVHASGFLGAFVLAQTTSRGKRVLAMLGFGLFYLVFVGAFMVAFGEWWPLVAFGWLLFGKIAAVLGRGTTQEQRAQMMAGWMLSVVFYVLGVFATLLLPVPRLGMTADLLPQFGLTGSGVWVEQPHRVIAFGVLYFAFTAWSKWREWGVPFQARA